MACIAFTNRLAADKRVVEALPVNVFVPDQMLFVVVPNANANVLLEDKSPPPVIGYVVLIVRVVETLLLNVFQSVDVIHPFVDVLASAQVRTDGVEPITEIG